MNILRKNAFKRERPRCPGPRYLLINKITALYKMIKNVTKVIPHVETVMDFTVFEIF